MFIYAETDSLLVDDAIFILISNKSMGDFFYIPDSGKEWEVGLQPTKLPRSKPHKNQ